MRPYICFLKLLVLLVVPGWCCAAEAPSAPAQESVDLTRPLTLQRAIQIALEYQPQLGIAQSRLEGARARVTQAMASYYPQIAPLYQYSNSRSPVTTGSGTTSVRSERSTSSITARQLLFDTGKREANVAISRANQRATQYSLIDTRQAIVLNVTNAYYELLRRQELVKVQEASVARAKTTLDATRAAAEVGTAPKKDILQAEADHDNALVQLSIAQNDVRISQTALKNAMGIISPVAIITDPEPLAEPAAEPDSLQIPDYVRQAIENRPDLKRDLAGIDADRQSVKLSRINAGLQVEADVSEGYLFEPVRGENRQFTTIFTYPLFDAGISRARIQEAKAGLKQSELQLELTRQSIQLEVEQAYLLREEARSRVAATRSAVRAARLNYEAAREAQKEGAGTIIDVITAQTQLVTAETSAVQAIYDYYTADARLRRAVGAIDPSHTGGKVR